MSTHLKGSGRFTKKVPSRMQVSKRGNEIPRGINLFDASNLLQWVESYMTQTFSIRPSVSFCKREGEESFQKFRSISDIWSFNSDTQSVIFGHLTPSEGGKQKLLCIKKAVTFTVVASTESFGRIVFAGCDKSETGDQLTITLCKTYDFFRSSRNHCFTQVLVPLTR